MSKELSFSGMVALILNQAKTRKLISYQERTILEGYNKINELQSRLKAQEPYLRHKKDCAISRWFSMGCIYKRPACDCGLDKVKESS